MTAPLVSAVIATRDRPALVCEAIQSALDQVDAQIEVVVVDDGSDPPLRLPPPLATHRSVTLLRTDRRLGIGGARNVGAERCGGDYLAFLDDDDRWLPGKTAAQVAALEAAGPEVAATETGFNLVEDGRVLERFLPLPDTDLPSLLLERSRLVPSTVVIRRSAFDELGGFDPSMEAMEDWELWLRLVDRFEVIAIPEVWVERRPSHANADRRDWYAEVVRRLEPRLQALPPGERRRLRAHHRFYAGVHAGRSGHRWVAARDLVDAWRIDPRRARPLLHLPRLVVGEAVWAVASARLRSLRRRSRGDSGPRVYRW